MIQRIQTIYLIAVVAISSLYFFLPFCTYTLPESQYIFKITGVEKVSLLSEPATDDAGTTPLMIVLGLIVIISLVTIFNFKKRLLQIKMGRFIIFLNALLIVLVFYDADQVSLKTGVHPDYQFGLLIPAIAIVLTVLANRAIRKDEELVRAADRIR
jgi:hypothetical protein